MLRSIIATHHPAGSAGKRGVAGFVAIHQVPVDESVGLFSVFGEISPRRGSPTCCLLMAVQNKTRGLSKAAPAFVSHPSHRSQILGEKN